MKIEIRDSAGAVVERYAAQWAMDIYGRKDWSGLAHGDRVYADGVLVFVAEDQPILSDGGEKPYFGLFGSRSW